MNKEDDDYFEMLAKNYPDLMQKSQQDYLGVGPGWFNIINVLCERLSYRVTQARYKIGYVLENPDNKYNMPMEELEKELEEALEELPTIDQIKEKFGGLRFYYHGGTEAHGNYVEFAESMSYHICEECGAPGESRNTSWIRVRCDRHHEELEAKENPKYYPPRKTIPKFNIE